VQQNLNYVLKYAPAAIRSSPGNNESSILKEGWNASEGAIIFSNDVLGSYYENKHAGFYQRFIVSATGNV